MDDVMFSMAISLILTKLKDKKFVAKAKPALLKVRNAINELFPNE